MSSGPPVDMPTERWLADVFELEERVVPIPWPRRRGYAGAPAALTSTTYPPRPPFRPRTTASARVATPSSPMTLDT